MKKEANDRITFLTQEHAVFIRFEELKTKGQLIFYL